MAKKTEYVVKYRKGPFVITRFSEDWVSTWRFIKGFLEIRGIYNYTVQKVETLAI